jgi:hypothetical protein
MKLTRVEARELLGVEVSNCSSSCRDWRAERAAAASVCRRSRLLSAASYKNRLCLCHLLQEDADHSTLKKVICEVVFERHVTVHLPSVSFSTVNTDLCSAAGLFPQEQGVAPGQGGRGAEGGGDLDVPKDQCSLPGEHHLAPPTA